MYYGRLEFIWSFIIIIKLNHRSIIFFLSSTISVLTATLWHITAVIPTICVSWLIIGLRSEGNGAI